MCHQAFRSKGETDQRSQASFVVHLLSLSSFANAAYTFYRRRHYRLFESSLDVVPITPSAHRVKVDSSPVASSPLRFLSGILTGHDAEARSHPDPTKDVWEIAVWDPTPISLRMFCLLSPGHVLIYWFFLPTATTDPRPSTTVLTTVLLVVLLSAQLLLLCSSFSQQSKDSAVIHKEVLNEYDTKFVHPRTQPLMRDVGTQFSGGNHTYNGLPRYDGREESVDIYTPTFVINKGFSTRPNPNYLKYVDPEGRSYCTAPSEGVPSDTQAPYQTPPHQRDLSSPLKPYSAARQPQFRSITTGDGGNLGVYTHANSPLRKSASTGFSGPVGQRERTFSPQKKDGSPLKNSLAPMPHSYRAGHMKTAQLRRESGKF